MDGWIMLWIVLMALTHHYPYSISRRPSDYYRISNLQWWWNSMNSINEKNWNVVVGHSVDFSVVANDFIRWQQRGAQKNWRKIRRRQRRDSDSLRWELFNFKTNVCTYISYLNRIFISFPLRFFIIIFLALPHCSASSSHVVLWVHHPKTQSGSPAEYMYTENVRPPYI